MQKYNTNSDDILMLLDLEDSDVIINSCSSSSSVLFRCLAAVSNAISPFFIANNVIKV